MFILEIAVAVVVVVLMMVVAMIVVVVVQSNKLFLIGHKMTTNDLVAINTPIYTLAM